MTNTKKRTPKGKVGRPYGSQGPSKSESELSQSASAKRQRARNLRIDAIERRLKDARQRIRTHRSRMKAKWVGSATKDPCAEALAMSEAEREAKFEEVMKAYEEEMRVQGYHPSQIQALVDESPDDLGEKDVESLAKNIGEDAMIMGLALLNEIKNADANRREDMIRWVKKSLLADVEPSVSKLPTDSEARDAGDGG